MKKILWVVVTCMLIFSGCSSNNEIAWGETVQSSNWEFKITDIEFVGSYSYGSSLYRADADSIYIGVEYTLKNISKSNQYFNPESHIMQIDYDSYIFEHDKGWYKSSVGWVQSGEELKPLSDAVGGKMYFEVPKEVEENADNDLKININIGKKYECYIRPFSEKSNQGKYDKALEHIEKEEYSKAITKLEELGDFQESKEKLNIAQEGYHFEAVATENSKKFFNENKDKYEIVPAQDIGNLTSNEWDFSKYGLPVKFKEKGELYNAHIKYEDIHWSFEQGLLVIDYKKYGRMDKFEVRQFDKNKYLLYKDGQIEYTLSRPDWY